MEKRENTGIDQSGSKENHASSSSNNAPHPKPVSNIEGEYNFIYFMSSQ